MILVCIAVHETCVAFYIACDWSPSVYNVNEAHCSVLKELGKGVVREFFFSFYIHGHLISHSSVHKHALYGPL